MSRGGKIRIFGNFNVLKIFLSFLLEMGDTILLKNVFIDLKYFQTQSLTCPILEYGVFDHFWWTRTCLEPGKIRIFGNFYVFKIFLSFLFEMGDTISVKNGFIDLKYFQTQSLTYPILEYGVFDHFWSTRTCLEASKIRIFGNFVVLVDTVHPKGPAT